MRNSLTTILLASLVATAVAWSSPAAATDAREAMKACDKNPNCDYKVNPNGSVNLWTKNEGNHSEVHCPPKGACQCISCPSGPTRTQVGQGVQGDVTGVLSGSSTGPSGPKATGEAGAGAGKER